MNRFALVAALAAAASAAVAQDAPKRAAPPQAVVEAVQMPAWVERGGARVPLAPGMGLQPNDELRTGADARLLLKLADGSSVKLGEAAQLRLTTIATRKDNVFTSAMNVLQGAFRFTTDALARTRRRDVTVTVATVTAGIRGTDLWGKAAADRDIVCLIEGRVEVSRQGDPTVTMDQPLSFYIAPRGSRRCPSRRSIRISSGSGRPRPRSPTAEARRAAAGGGRSCSLRASRRTKSSACTRRCAPRVTPRSSSRAACRAGAPTTSASRVCRRRPRPRRSRAGSPGSTACRRRA